MTLRTVNLIWEKKIRSSYPVSPYALGDDGTLVRAVPRPLEARTWDLARVHPDESVENGGWFSAETLLKLDVAASGQNALGMTSDDIYLFQEGSKTRFLDSRQNTYIDAALCANGKTLAVAYTDVAGQNFGLACGGIGGRVAWLQETADALTALAISRDGKQIAYGAESGMLRMVSSGKQEIWAFEQHEPIRAVACSADGSVVAYGTAEGNIGWIDSGGVRRWEMRFPGEIVALALSGEGELCAAIVAPKEGEGTKLACLVGNGQVGWEYNTERRLTRAAVSANGKYVTVGSRDGATVLYEMVWSALSGGLSGSATRREYERADALEKSGDLMGAYRILRDALDADPTNAELCERVIALHKRWEDTQREAILALVTAKNPVGAIDAAEKMLQDDPRNIHAMSLLKLGLEAQAAHLLNEAKGSEPAQAEALLMQALSYDPFLTEARRELGTIRARRAADADAEAEYLFTMGDFPAGLTALERAQAVAPTPERAQRIVRTQITSDYAAGLEFYNAKRYEQAIFQFRKVLARDASHSDAKRYLNFAQKFAQDALHDTVGDRFNHLED